MDIQAEYDCLLAASEASGSPDQFVSLSRQFVKHWRNFDWLLSLVPVSLADAVVVDIGCKYGHAAPLFLARGARRVVGVEVEEEYLEAGRKILGKLFPRVEFEQSHQGLIPLAPTSVDFVFMNEVISHVNPTYLDVLYGEVARILKPGGYVLIADGNNIANADCRRDLYAVYEAWENGPSGQNTGRDVVNKPFVDRRRDMIRDRYSQLPEEKVDYLARNTFGLFGTTFLDAVDQYVQTGQLVERSFRPGVFPTNPRASGVVMERGFHPCHVELSLAQCGIRAWQIMPTPSGLFSRLCAIVGRLWWCLAGRSLMEMDRGRSWDFQILGVKDL